MRLKTNLLYLAGLFLLVACGSQPNPETLNLALTSDIKGFDPAQSVDVASGQVMALVYDNLVHFGDSTELVPGIAKSWHLSTDGKAYAFDLNRGFRFHDGTEITAGDVKFSFERAQDGPQAWLFSRLDDIILPQGEEGYAIQIRLTEPFAPFLKILAMPAAAIVNRKAVQNGSADLRTAAAGSGPWKLQQWVRDGHLLFTRNEDYFYNSAKVRNLKFRIISEEMTQAAEFEAGNLDIMGIPGAEYEIWVNNPKWQGLIHSQRELSIYYIGLNCSRPPFNDARVRQAMNYAVDREKILRFVLSGQSILAHGVIPPALAGYDPNRKPFSYDPARARKLLAEAGYPNGFSMELWQSQASGLAQIMEAFQSYWRAVGIDAKIVKNDWNVFKTAVREGKPDAYYLDWFGDYPDAENFLFPLFHSSESMTKRNRYSNPQVDRLIETIQHLFPSEKRAELLRQVDRMIYEDAPWVFLWHSTSHTVVQPWIRGYTPRLMFNAQRYLDVEKILGPGSASRRLLTER